MSIFLFQYIGILLCRFKYGNKTHKNTFVYLERSIDICSAQGDI
jgi:hypothetical protein